MNRTVARYAVFGHPVSHSRSPAIHARFAEQTGQVLVYEAIDPGPDGFEEAARRFFTEGGKGANVTLPFKEAAFKLADELSEHAQRAGAVNTLKVLEDGRLLGDNSDGAGLVRDLTENLGIELVERNVLLLGAGGAARGILGPLIDAGINRLHIANRTPGKAAILAERFQGPVPITTGGLDAWPSTAFDLIISATAAGLGGESPDLPRRLLAPGALCYDLLYGPELTPFQHQAIQHGAHVADGWGMLVEQAAESFTLWRGVRPDTSDIKSIRC